MRYPILELESIPRSKDLLTATILDARRQTRRRNLTRFAAVNLLVWALFIMLVWPQMQAGAAAPTLRTPANHVIYVPSVDKL